MEKEESRHLPLPAREPSCLGSLAGRERGREGEEEEEKNLSWPSGRRPTQGKDPKIGICKRAMCVGRVKVSEVPSLLLVANG